jgi:hypothetical protein
MQWLICSLAAVFLLPVSAFAQTPLQYYRELEGHWLATQNGFELNYKVAAHAVHIEGQECNASAQGPTLCDDIDQSYQAKGESISRDGGIYGELPVQIVELSEHRLVRREANPVNSKETALTTEELVDPDTLRFVSETWVEGASQPQSRREFTLHRDLTPATVAASN